MTMADSDEDPTTAIPIGHTQPMSPPLERAPEPGRPSGWRPGQVAVVAVLALLLGGAGATLAWLAADRGEQEPFGAAAPSTTSTIEEEADDSTSSTSSTRPFDDDSEGNQGRGNRSEGNQSQSNRSGGQTVVGNGVFTGTYQSNDDQTTDDFTVDDDWDIRWDVVNGTATIEVQDATGEVVETIEAQGQGDSTITEGGTYRLDISSNGARYTVVVTDGP